jgi:hypothetical protein
MASGKRPPRLTPSELRKLPKKDTKGNLIVAAAYMWTTWNAVVRVIKRGRKLYVKPPGGVEIQVTARTAGDFIPVEDKS